MEKRGKGVFIICLIFFLNFPTITWSDTLHTSRYKFGIKFSAERAALVGLSPDYFPVFNSGFQCVRRFGMSCWSLESGLYRISKEEMYGDRRTVYRCLAIPVNLRWDFKTIYISAGFFADYFLMVNSSLSAYDPLDPRRRPNQGYNLAAGYEKKISNAWNAFFEARLFVSQFERPPGLYFQSYGLSMGLNYTPVKKRKH